MLHCALRTLHVQCANIICGFLAQKEHNCALVLTSIGPAIFSNFNGYLILQKGYHSHNVLNMESGWKHYMQVSEHPLLCYLREGKHWATFYWRVTMVTTTIIHVIRLHVTTRTGGSMCFFYCMVAMVTNTENYLFRSLWQHLPLMSDPVIGVRRLSRIRRCFHQLLTVHRLCHRKQKFVKNNTRKIIDTVNTSLSTDKVNSDLFTIIRK